MDNMSNKEKMKQLRDETGISISVCKNALEKNNWDLEGARETLREEYANLAFKKIDRETNEKAVGIKVVANDLYYVQVSCETDFVLKNDQFSKMCNELLDQIVNKNYEFNVSSYIAALGENITVLKYGVFHAKNHLSYYLHSLGGGSPLGSIFAAIDYNGINLQMAKHSCQHIVFHKPTSIEEFKKTPWIMGNEHTATDVFNQLEITNFIFIDKNSEFILNNS